MIRRLHPLTAPVRYIHPEDPALDSSAPGTFGEAFRAYVESYDLTGVEALVRPGATPTVWTVIGLTRAQMLHCQGIASEAVRDDAIVSFGLVSVEGLQDADGRTIVVAHADAGMGIAGPLGRAVTPASMSEVYDPGIMRQLAAVIWRRSRLCP